MLVAVALLVYAADVISKVIVVATLTENVPVRVVGSLLQLDYLRNPGAAFSLGADGYTVVFTLIAAAVIVAILRMARTLASGRWAVALGLLLGGALGNLTDRIARGPGPAARLGRRLHPAAALAGVQPGRLGDLLWRCADGPAHDPGRAPGRPGQPPARRGNPRAGPGRKLPVKPGAG